MAGPNEVKVALSEGGEATIQTKNIMIATGSDSSSVPGLEIDEQRCVFVAWLTSCSRCRYTCGCHTIRMLLKGLSLASGARRIVSSMGALELKEVPEKLIVVGGGVIGLEMGSVWSRLGAEVTVLEYTDTIVPSLDADIRKAFERVLKKQGIKIKTGQKVLGADTSGAKVTLSFEGAKDGKQASLEADIVLVSTGRRPVTGARTRPRTFSICRVPVAAGAQL